MKLEGVSPRLWQGNALLRSMDLAAAKMTALFLLYLRGLYEPA